MRLYFSGYHKNEKQIFEGYVDSDLISLARRYYKMGETSALVRLLCNEHPECSGRLMLVLPTIIEDNDCVVADIVNGTPTHVEDEDIVYGIGPCASSAVEASLK